jgi:hypothetical protein
VPGVRQKRDDDATRVHRVPKDILLRLQARAAATAVESLHAERTAVFRAPPELLERAKGMGAADRADPAAAAEEELTQPLPVPAPSSAPGASAESSGILDFQDSTEATSGISQRPQGLGPRAQAEAEVEVEAEVASAVPAESLEPSSSPAPSSLPPSSPALSSPAPSAPPLNDDSTRWSPVPVARAALHADVDELLSTAPVVVAQQPPSMLDSSDRASVPPQFRQRSWPTLVLVALLAVAAVWFVLTQR